MKTLVKNSVSLLILADDVPVKLGPVVEIGDPARYTLDNADGLIKLYEGVTPPDGYKGKRFCFDGKKWTTNNLWKDPSLTARKR